MTDTFLPRRPAKPAPAFPPDVARQYRGSGLDVVTVLGECVVCGAEQSNRWTPVALDGLRHRHRDVDIVAGYCCRDCEDAAEQIADASRRAAGVASPAAVKAAHEAHAARNRR